jgi:hypothetical protein
VRLRFASASFGRLRRARRHPVERYRERAPTCGTSMTSSACAQWEILVALWMLTPLASTSSINVSWSLNSPSRNRLKVMPFSLARVSRIAFAVGDLLRSGERRLCELRRWHLYRQDPKGREARRPAGPAADDIRAGGQPQDRRGARPHGPAHDPRPRRRGHRVKQANGSFGSA